MILAAVIASCGSQRFELERKAKHGEQQKPNSESTPPSPPPARLCAWSSPLRLRERVLSERFASDDDGFSRRRRGSAIGKSDRPRDAYLLFLPLVERPVQAALRGATGRMAAAPDEGAKDYQPSVGIMRGNPSGLSSQGKQQAKDGQGRSMDDGRAQADDHSRRVGVTVLFRCAFCARAVRRRGRRDPHVASRPGPSASSPIVCLK